MMGLQLNEALANQRSAEQTAKQAVYSRHAVSASDESVAGGQVEQTGARSE